MHLIDFMIKLRLRLEEFLYSLRLSLVSFLYKIAISDNQGVGGYQMHSNSFIQILKQYESYVGSFKLFSENQIKVFEGCVYMLLADAKEIYHIQTIEDLTKEFFTDYRRYIYDFPYSFEEYRQLYYLPIDLFEQFLKKTMSIN